MVVPYGLKVKIMTKKWIESHFNDVKYKVHLTAFDGSCSPPEQADREAEINLPHGFKRDRYTMELLIHEGTHAIDWNLTEKQVEAIGRDLSKFLWKLYKPRKGII